MDKALKAITDWNINHKIGTTVRAKSNITGYIFSPTVSEATLLGGIVPVVWVKVKRGCRLLEDVEAI